MKTKKRKYAAQSCNGDGVRHVDLLRVTMPSGGFEAPGYSLPHCVLHPVTVLSTTLSSPPAPLHLLIFSTSSSRSPPRRCSLHPVAVFHLDLVFSTSSPSSPPPHRLLHSGAMFSMSCRATFAVFSASSSFPRRWLLPSIDRRFFSVGRYAGVVFPSWSFASWDTMPVSYFSLFAVVLTCWIVLLSLSRVSSGKPSRWFLCRRWVLSGAQGH
jgi:hypothetical protein